MEIKPQLPVKGSGSPLFSLNKAIDALDLARDTTNAKPAKDAFGSASLLLTAIRVCFLLAYVGRLQGADLYLQDSTIKEVDCVELGLTCAEICQTLDRGVHGRQQERLSQSILEAIGQLKT